MTDRAPRKAFSNEIKSPFVVEVPVAANGLDVELNRQMVGFHKADLETARAFVEQFGGAFYKTTGA